MNHPQLLKIRQTEASLWRKDLADFQFSLFLLPEWLDSLSDNKHQPLYLDFHIDNRVVAKLSGLVCNESRLKGRQLYFYAAPAFLQDTLHLFEACHRILRQWAIEQKYTRVVVASYDQQTTQECAAEGYYPNYRYEYLVYFNESGAQGKFATGFKKNFKKAQKLGAAFHLDLPHKNFERLLTLLGVTKQLRVKKYGSHYNPFYLKNMSVLSLRRLLDSGVGKIYYASLDNCVNCIQLNIEADSRSYGLLMGSDDSAYQNGLPSFVDFNLIEQYSKQGFRYYNPGGGPVDNGGSGIEQYKKAMGGQKLIFAGSNTNFLIYPQKLLNPLLLLGRNLPHPDKGVIGFLKRLV